MINYALESLEIEYTPVFYMRLFGEKKWDSDRIWRSILGAAVVLFLFLLLSVLRGVLIPFAMAFVLAYVLSPIVDFLTRRRFRRSIAVFLTLFILFGMITAAAILTMPRVISELGSVSSRLADYLRYAYNFLYEKVRGTAAETENKVLDAVIDQLKSGDIANYFREALFGIFSGIVSISFYLISFAVVPIAAFFFLSDFHRISDRWQLYIPKQIRDKTVPFIIEVNDIISAFFRGQFIIILILAVLFSIGFSIVGVPIAIVMGITIGFLNLIPYFGTLAGLVPLALLTLGKSLDLGENPLFRLGGVAAVMIIVQIIQDWVLTPQIMKHRVGLRPITILMSAVIWGKLLGIMGLFLAIPLSAVGKVYFHRYFLIKKEIEKAAAEDLAETFQKTNADE